MGASPSVRVGAVAERFDVGAPFEPDVPIEISPLFNWPPKPTAVARTTLRSFAGPVLLLHVGLAFAVWYALTPDLSSMSTLRPGWIAQVWVRNAMLLTVVAGGLHLLLHRRRHQGDRFKYNARWLAVDSAKYTTGDQTRDNVLWSIASGVTVWTAYEAITWWLFATERIELLSWGDRWWYLLPLTLSMVLWSQLHFYLNHRLLHWEPLYRAAHSLHHRNVNTGPWSGIAMHPLEHLVYFSAPVLLWFVPGHPVVVVMLLLYSGISPAFSHAGFERVELFGRVSFRSGDYYHHLHHRYFECNYGNRLVPVDVLFGTYHDGTAEAHARMRERRRAGQR